MKFQAPITITIGNQKGGVGKTTTTVNLAGAFGRAGYRVLVLDADPQGNSSSILLQDIELRERYSLVKALEAPVEAATLSAMACPTASKRIDIIPNTSRCILWERAFAQHSDAAFGFFRLTRHDRRLQDYDIILIDTPPNMGTMMNNALMISDFSIIPIPCSDIFALDGLAVFLKLHQSIRNQNQKLKLFGVFFTKFDPANDLHVGNCRKIRKFFTAKGLHVLTTPIRMDTDLDRAHMKRRTIFELGAGNHGAEDYTALSAEVLELIAYEDKRRERKTGRGS